MPAFVRAVLAGGANVFDEISLFEPDPVRRETTGRLAVELAGVLGHPGMVTQTADPDEAFTGASFVFSAIRVGGDQGRVIDEQVALQRGLVGQETTGPGGAAMALRTIPVVLVLLRAASPGARRRQCSSTSPTRPGSSPRRSRCTAGCGPSGCATRPTAPWSGWGISSGPSRRRCRSHYSGLNHLGWISSFTRRGGGADRRAARAL